MGLKPIKSALAEVRKACPKHVFKQAVADFRKILELGDKAEVQPIQNGIDFLESLRKNRKELKKQ